MSSTLIERARALAPATVVDAIIGAATETERGEGARAAGLSPWGPFGDPKTLAKGIWAAAYGSGAAECLDLTAPVDAGLFKGQTPAGPLRPSVQAGLGVGQPATRPGRAL